MANGFMATTGLMILPIMTILMSFIMVRMCYKKCPPSKIMVIYGNVGMDRSGTPLRAKYIHGSAAFIVPFIQTYEFLDLKPISIPIELRNALSKEHTQIDIFSTFIVGISEEMELMEKAGERLLGVSVAEIQRLAKEIILGQLRLIIGTLNVEDIDLNKEKFVDDLYKNVGKELNKLGLYLINNSISGIKGPSGKKIM